MSWLWGPSKPKADGTSVDVNVHQEIEPTPVPTSSTPSPIRALSREEQANQDFAELLRELQEDQSSAKEDRIRAKEIGLPNATPIPEDISPDSLYPIEMSCRSALDYAMFCQSFGGQFVNIYRYGSFRSCSNHWDDFWTCMRTRTWDEKDKQKAIQDHYKKKAIKWKTGVSSEDVWEVRKEPVKDAFQDNLEELEAKISEWKKANPGVPDPWLKQQGATFNNPAPRS